ncbi:MAG: ABC transporter permease, partial [Bacillota bacterium]
MAVKQHRSGVAGVRGGLWLGWMSESNWTDLSLFFGYSIVKPLAQSLILAVIYLVIARSAQTPYFAAMMVGNAFFMVTGQIMQGATWCVIEDREFYSTIRYIYIAGRSMIWYLLGRAAAKAIIVAFSSLVVLLFARFAMGAPLTVNAGWVLPGSLSLALGVGATALMGVGLAGVLLLAARNAAFYSEAVSGSLYLLAGAIFPIEVLPGVLQRVAQVLPQTY